MEFVNEMISTIGLVEEVDYEIASFLVEVNDADFITLDEVFKVKSQVYFRELDFNEDIFEKLSKYLKANGLNYTMSRTRQPSYANCDTFYLLNQEIDIASAYTFGFGVVKMIRGEYKGLYMLYNFNKVYENGFEKSDVLQEIISLKMYLQYVNYDAYYDNDIKTFVKQDEKLARALLTRDEDRVIKMFEMIFEAGIVMGDVVISQKSHNNYLIQ